MLRLVGGSKLNLGRRANSRYGRHRAEKILYGSGFSLTEQFSKV
jgi:hypothetical protein